jgi:hypothetical protein
MGRLEFGFEKGLADEFELMLQSGEWKRREKVLFEPPKNESQIAKSARERFKKHNVFFNFYTIDRDCPDKEVIKFVEHFIEAKEKENRPT